MHLRKTLTLAAAVLATGLLGLASTSQADPPTGGPIATVEINGNSTPMGVPVTGYYTGTGSIDNYGQRWGCYSGNGITGAFNRGTHPLGAGGHDLVLFSLNLICGSGAGQVTWSIDPGCAYMDFGDGDVHNGTVDTGTGPDFSAVAGVLVLGTGTCVTVSSGRSCGANLQGTFGVDFDETIKQDSSGRYQEMTLRGTGAYANQSGCYNTVTGTVTLNNIVFRIRVDSGTTTGIDFRQPAPTSGGPVAAVEVDGTRSAGAVPIDGIYGSGTYGHSGITYGCSSGTAAGTVNRGPRPAAGVHELVLSTLNLVCNSAVGGGTPPGYPPTGWSITPGCVINVDLPDTSNAQGSTASVHDGTLDTGTATDYGPVTGKASVANQCLTFTGIAGYCTAKASGTVGVSFDEAIKTVGGVKYQELTLNGSGLTLTTQTGCVGLMTGAIGLNNLKFDVQVSSGTTTGIDFRQTP